MTPETPPVLEPVTALASALMASMRTTPPDGTRNDPVLDGYDALMALAQRTLDRLPYGWHLAQASQRGAAADLTVEALAAAIGAVHDAGYVMYEAPFDDLAAAILAALRPASTPRLDIPDQRDVFMQEVIRTYGVGTYSDLAMRAIEVGRASMQEASTPE